MSQCDILPCDLHLFIFNLVILCYLDLNDPELLIKNVIIRFFELFIRIGRISIRDWPLAISSIEHKYFQELVFFIIAFLK